MTGNGRKPTRLRQQAIAALITQPTVDAASKACGVSPSTLNRWLRDERFAAEIAEARNQVLTAAIDRLKTAAFDAVGVLTEISKNPASSDMARVNAAKFLVELALRVGAMEQLEARIAELERGTNGVEDAATAGRTIEGNEEQEPNNGNDDWGETRSDWQIALPESVQ